MRKIKFRAWFEGHMYEVAKLDFWGCPEQATCDMAGTGENGEWEELFNIYVGEVELMQYTGLKDKNGNEIYEDDILKTWIGGYEQASPYVVEDMRELYFELERDDSYYRIQKTEILGNIYENPNYRRKNEFIW